MGENHAEELLARYELGLCTPEEEVWLQEWYDQLPSAEITGDAWVRGQRVYAGIAKQLKKRRIAKIVRLTVAAAAVAALFLCVYIWQQPPHTALAKQQPGNPTLILANGVIMDLDTSGNGLQVKGKHIKYMNGKSIGDVTTAPDAYMTLRTPAGMQYMAQLPDGSKVWLNAASSLQYPSAFTGKERRVTLEGEGYFEIAQNAQQPFIVNAQQLEVNVLGTSFNIHAYSQDKPVVLSLLQGSTSANGKILRPGQQAVLDKGIIAISNANVTDAVMWRAGYFVFHDNNLEDILEEVGRWYSVEFSFDEQALKQKKFWGMLKRTSSLPTIMSYLAQTKEVTFRKEGKLIIVSRPGH